VDSTKLDNKKEDKMGSDCTIPIDDGLLNIRVGAIICRGNEFLMMENDKDPFLYSVGGRVKFGETAQEAIVREVLEETGTQMEIDRLGFVHENYFYLDEPGRENQVVYEISFYFYMKMPEDFSPVCESFTGSNHKERLVWLTMDGDEKIYPEFFRTELKQPCGFVKHMCTDDRR
jgi:NUDIX domain-containing protein